ncbi:3063_t:CDS:10 [Diversispora eburnea]|uniref:3063_t:CDS:1 n=1 Tax=Diversispora eburnea TaxID=1213867 RepID=A0A9N8YQY4_9GLOM|nr:3063_t:CDS:10 [Diversispora eburnea]
MADIKKRLVFSILQFLQQSTKDGTIKKEEDKEGIDVAVQCISEAFGVNPEDPDQKALYSTKVPLLSIFDVAIKTQERMTKPSSSRSVPVSQNTAETKIELNEEQKQKAEELKISGNRKVAEKDYNTAIQLYSEAITINGNNAVYYANRAAAYSQLGQHDKAIEDAIKSSQIDPSYSKSYSRLGHAYFSIAKYKEAIEAYEKGLSLDPENQTMKSALAAAEQKTSELQNENTSGGNSTDGGTPSLLNNPALMGMARSMMQSGAFNDIMNNPNLASMAQNMMQGGAPPNLEEMMNNPDIMNAARQFANNQGGNNPPPPNSENQ